MNIQNSQMRLAILIPVYNRQAELERTCSSLPLDIDYDLVIIDDGSHPAISVPSALNLDHVALLRLTENQGVTRALNHGLQWIFKKDYRYVARVDAGDMVLPPRLVRQVNFLDAHPDYAVVGGQARFVDARGRELFHDNFPTADVQIRPIMHGRSCFLDCAITMRVAALRIAGLYDERFPNAEGFEMCWRLLQDWKGANLLIPIVDYVVNPDGLSLSKRSQQVRSRIRVLLTYFDPWAWQSYAGLAKNLMLLIVPYRWVSWVKRRHIHSHRGWL